MISIATLSFFIYKEQPDDDPNGTYSRAGSTQVTPLEKKLISPSCPVKYKTSAIPREESKLGPQAHKYFG